MIFHQPDKAAPFRRLAQLSARAKSFAVAGVINPGHPLAAAWSNAKLLIPAVKASPDDVADGLAAVDWFAGLLDRHSQTNMLAGDASIAAMLHEAQSFLGQVADFAMLKDFTPSPIPQLQ